MSKHSLRRNRGLVSKGTVTLQLEGLESREVPALIGALDPSFGTNGIFTAFGAGNTTTAEAVDHFGRTIVVGDTPGTGGNDFLVVRLNPNGTLDTTFGSNGKVQIDFGGGDDRASGVVVDSSDNIVVEGTSFSGGVSKMAFARLSAANGSLDSTFGGGGTGELLLAAPAGYTNLTGNGVAIDTSGRIVAVGDANAGGANDFAVVRLTSAGVLDTSFNAGAVKTLTVSATSNDLANAVTIDHNGNIVVAGQTTDAGVSKIAVFRLLPGAALDTGFNGGSILAFNIGAGTTDDANAVAVDSANNVYLAGLTSLGGVSRLTATKLTSGGVIDTTFGSGGTYAADPGAQGFSEANGIAVQPNGRVVVGGTTRVSVTAFSFVVAQLLPNGSLDPTFNSVGSTPGQNVFAPTTGAASFLSALTLTPSGHIVVAGTNNTTGGIEVARLTGQVDASSSELAVGGSTNGQALLYGSNPANGQINTTALATIAAFGSLNVNVRVAVADVNGDGIPDTILITGPGTALRLAVVSGVDNSTLLVQPFDPFGGGFTGGGFVSAADFNNDGRADIIVTPDQGGGPRVTIFELTAAGFTTEANFFGIADPNFRGGARAGAGDVNGDGVPDLVVAAGFGGGPRVAVYDGTTVFSSSPTKLVNDFFVFPDVLRNGVYVAVGDLNGDGFDDLIIGAGPGGGPRLMVLSGQVLLTQGAVTAVNSPLANFFVGGADSTRGGVRVAAKNLDGDNRVDIVTGTGGGAVSSVRAYLGVNVTANGEPTTFQDLNPFNSAVLADGVYVG